MALTLASDALAISSVTEWGELWKPQRPAHWANGKSAKELAKAWFRPGPAPAIPRGLRLLLESDLRTRDLCITNAIGEKVIELDDFPGMCRHADLVLYGKSAAGIAVIHVEAKADEEFGGETVGEAWRECVSKLGSNKAQRIENLCGLLFETPPLPRALDAIPTPLKGLRYQLLHGAVAPLLEAVEMKASTAVFVVHQLLPRNRNHIFFDDRGSQRAPLDWKKVEQNERDLRDFIAALPNVTPREFVEGRFVEVGGCAPPNKLTWKPARGSRVIPLLIGKATDATDVD